MQQQTISAEGLSGIAFSTNVPHTVRGQGRHQAVHRLPCLQNNDNNAIMAQLLMQGTNYLNFIGRYCWVAAGEHGLRGGRRHRARRAAGGHRQHAAQAGLSRALSRSTSRTRPAARASPTSIPARTSASRSSAPAARPKCCSVQARGEYLYAACGEAGVRVFDIAFIDHKGFSERITTAPVSPLGQQFYVPHQVRHGRRRPDDDRARPDPHALPGEQGTGGPRACTATSTSPTSTRA